MTVPRLTAWNLRHGGGAKRMAPITLAILEHVPDAVILTEFRRTTGGQIAAVLADHGLCHQISTDPGKGRNGILVASRAPFDVSRADALPLSRDAGDTCTLLQQPDIPLPDALRQRWVEVRLPSFQLEIIAVHVPHDDPFSNRGPSTPRSACFHAIVREAHTRVDRPVALIGDFNAGRHYIDEEGATFTLTAALGRIASLGYIDAWRYLNPEKREFSWYSHQGDGFRIDHAFLSPPLALRLRACRYDHLVRTQGLSDHSMLIMDLA
jgi:exodeoxyribonuclease-3